jgi:hypothetical protein
MGYCAKQVDGKFFLPYENRKAAFDALSEALPACKGLPYLHEQLEEYGWSTRCDGEGGFIDSIWFEGEKWREQDEPLKVIAPFVRHGSFIEMLGEDGERWRLTFWNGTLIEQKCKLVWDELPPAQPDPAEAK